MADVSFTCVKRLLVELHYTLCIKQTVIIFYLFMITPLSNVFLVAFYRTACNADAVWR